MSALTVLALVLVVLLALGGLLVAAAMLSLSSAGHHVRVRREVLELAHDVALIALVLGIVGWLG